MIPPLVGGLSWVIRKAMARAPLHTRLLYREELRRSARYELSALARVSEGWLVAEPDRAEMLERAPGARLEVVPNGVVTRWGLAGLEGPKQAEAIFLGNMTVQHNVDGARYLAEEVWPRVRARHASAVLRLVGAHAPSLRRIGRQPGVVLEGFVADLAPLLRRAAVAVAPLRWASGLQNKVLETMAAGLPNVVTPIVNDAIGARPGVSIAVAETTEDLAATIGDLFARPREARLIGEAGSAHVRARFSWARAGERLGELLAGGGDSTPGTGLAGARDPTRNAHRD